ncbi:ABC transporter ATP-binding protein [Alkalihalobacillus sp. LMS6]|uniref:ABC transporter ATP-binding protein n=1 Tax=Alkalihalobacillus sp. LMS6 TaxID=2924034 RepID=UPI0020D1418C|nr:ABC transporter ATP-binding protein [Alkalihalobacillus sp. LMS6]UTR08219.1 ABC transporter ATP-binding protein [Alkalihalobacillus sp. LMS6]
MSHVELVNVCKSYDGQLFAVEDVQVSIDEGEFFILVGPSGCGKSTLLRMIAGLEQISAGEIKLHKQLANHLLPNERQLSMVFQNYALYPHLTVEENILFGLKVRKVKKEERKKRCLDAANMLGLTAYLDRKPKELSGGQRQRVALARAVVSQAKLCLMDEPLSNLDAKLRGQMRLEIRQLQKKIGMTMVYVTHDQVEAMTMGDRMMVMRDGLVQQIGSPIEIYNQPANRFVATFIGAPPMNVIRASVDRIHQQLHIGANHTFQLSEKEIGNISRDAVFVGVRPEHIVMGSAGKQTFSLQCTLVNSELLGSETMVSFYLNDELWKAKWIGQWPIQLGERITVSFSKDQLFLFDAETEETILAPFTHTELKTEVRQVEFS